MAAALLAGVRIYAIKVELLNRKTEAVTIDRDEKNMEVICGIDLEGDQPTFTMLTMQRQVSTTPAIFNNVIRLLWNPPNATTPVEGRDRAYKNRILQYSMDSQNGNYTAYRFTLDGLLFTDEGGYRCEFTAATDTVVSEQMFYYIRGVYDIPSFIIIQVLLQILHSHYPNWCIS